MSDSGEPVHKQNYSLRIGTHTSNPGKSRGIHKTALDFSAKPQMTALTHSDYKYKYVYKIYICIINHLSDLELKSQGKWAYNGA